MKEKHVKGMIDLLPYKVSKLSALENLIKNIVKSFGYQEIRTPIVELASLFKKSVGEVTELVQKQMYEFEDKKGLKLTLRPEGTVSILRAVSENGMLKHNQILS